MSLRHRRFFVVYCTYLLPWVHVNGHPYHVHTVELPDGQLTHAALQLAVCADRDESGLPPLQPYQVAITGFTELTSDEYATFLDEPADYPKPPTPVNYPECVLL
jgi:hypothetical protein